MLAHKLQAGQTVKYELALQLCSLHSPIWTILLSFDGRTPWKFKPSFWLPIFNFCWEQSSFASTISIRFEAHTICPFNGHSCFNRGSNVECHKLNKFQIIHRVNFPLQATIEHFHSLSNIRWKLWFDLLRLFKTQKILQRKRENLRWQTNKRKEKEWDRKNGLVREEKSIWSAKQCNGNYWTR